MPEAAQGFEMRFADESQSDDCRFGFRFHRDQLTSDVLLGWRNCSEGLFDVGDQVVCVLDPTERRMSCSVTPIFCRRSGEIMA